MIVYWDTIQSIVNNVISSMTQVYELFTTRFWEIAIQWTDIPIIGWFFEYLPIINPSLAQATIFELMIGTLFSMFIAITLVKWIIGIIM